MRSIMTYRAFRRNAARKARQLDEWRESAVDQANATARLGARTAQANAAREAAAKAIGDPNNSYLPRDHVASRAMLEFYRGEKQTRAISRIVRDLERAVA